MIGLILGIVAFVLPFIPYMAWSLYWIWYFAPIVAIAGVILSVMGMKKAKLENQPQGIFIAGLVISIIASLETLSYFLCAVACSSAYGAAGAAASQLLNF